MSDALQMLREAVWAIRADLAQTFDQPELVRDPDGNYILLPALAALVIAEAKAHAALTIGPGQILVVTLPLGTDRQTIDQMGDQVKAENLGFRVLFIAGAEQLAVAETG